MKRTLGLWLPMAVCCIANCSFSKSVVARVISSWRFGDNSRRFLTTTSCFFFCPTMIGTAAS